MKSKVKKYQLGGKTNKSFPLDPITITGKRIPKASTITDTSTKVDTIYPKVGNEFLFQKYNNPDYIIHRQKIEKELSQLEKALKKTDDILSAPSRYMTKAITGEYQDPSKAWGYKDPKGFKENAVNFGIDVMADPLNLLGAGIVKNTILKSVPKLVKVGKAAEVVNDINNSEYIIKASKDLAREYMMKGNNISKYTKGILDDDFAKYVNVAYKELPEYKAVIEKSLKLNKPQATIALINDAINIKNGKTNSYEPHYSKTSDFGPLASGYKGASKPKQANNVTKTLITKPVKKEQAVAPPTTPAEPMLMNQYNKIINGQKIPISKEEFTLINSKGKVTSDTMPSLLKGMIPDSLKNKSKLQIRNISKMQLGGPNLPPEGNQEMETPDILKGLQAEHKEMISTPDGQITNVAATKPHYSYTKDEITDNPEQGSFIGSAFEKMKLDKNLANFYVLGVVPQEYKEGEKPKEPVIRTLADYFPKTKSTPAEVLKFIQRKIPLNLDKDDVFAADSKKNNMLRRIPVLQLLAQMSDMQKSKLEAKGHTVQNKPQIYQFGGPVWDTVKKAKEAIGLKQVPDTGADRSYPWQAPIDQPATDPTAVTSLPEMDLTAISDATSKNLEQVNAEINDPNSPAWVSKTPYTNIFTKGIIGNMGLALQNPNANYFQVNTGLKNKMFQQVNTSQLQDRAKAAYNSDVIAPTLSYADQSGANVFQKANIVASKYSSINNKMNDIAVNTTLKNLDTSRSAASFENDINYKNYLIGNQNIQSRNKKIADISQFNIGLSNQYADARKYQGLYEDQKKGTLRNNQQTLLQTLAQLKFLQTLNAKPIK